MRYRVFIILSCLSLLPCEVPGDTLHVHPGGLGFYPTIQNAIDAAAPLDTVLLAPGIYTGEGNRGLNLNGKDVVLKGSGNQEDVVIDCEYEDIGIRFESSESSAAKLEFLTISNGENTEGGNGGGVVIRDSSPTLISVSILNCVSSHNAGLLLSNSSSMIKDCRLQGNEAWGSGGGGGVYNSGEPLFESTTFADNIAHYQGGAMDCGIYSAGEFRDCLFIGSQASQEGGAILVGTGSSVRIVNCQFINNQGKRGGAVFCGPAGALIDSCLIVNNYAEYYGGAIHFAYPPVLERPVLSNSVLYGNSGGAGGGGVTAYNASPILRNNTIVGNIGDEWNGAGVAGGTSSSITIENSIISFNIGPGVKRDGSSTIEISCSDVYGNTGGNYTNYMQDQTGINGNISEDPLFCDYDNWVLTLAEQSPCLPENNDCGVLMGALGMDCTLTGAEELPSLGVQLLPNFPNPFNPYTTLSIRLDEPGEVRLGIHDVGGRQVTVLHEGWLPAGTRTFPWRGIDSAGREVPSGVYFVVLTHSGGRISRKCHHRLIESPDHRTKKSP